MTQTVAQPIARSILLIGAAGLLLLASGASCQVTSPCTVETLRMRITTGGDDLRGGKDNLNVSIRWGTNGFQGVANVNGSANWPNGSEHLVDVRLNQPVPLSEIKSITLDHLAGGGLTVSPQTVLSPIGVLAGIQTADNWDMASLEVTAVGQGIGVVILRHGPKKFTGSDPVLNLRTDVPASSCASVSGAIGSGRLLDHARPGGSSGTLLNPATSGGLPGKSGASSGAGRPSAKLTQQQLNALIAKVHNAPGKLSPIVTNPAATPANPSLLGQLQQQKQIAMAERNQVPSSQGAAPSGSVSRAANLRLAPVRGPLSTAAAPAPSTPINRFATMTQSNVTASCAAFHGPAMTTISGQQGSAAVLTQDPQYNLVTIRGCNFGQGKGQAQLNSADGRKITGLTIDTWTDTLITCEIPTSLSGVLDQDNVSLVLFPTSGPQAQKSGLHFYAKRAELHLASIPASAATLVSIADAGGSPVAAKFSSPYTSSPSASSKATASGGVDRFNDVRFQGGTDVFNFSKLKPGFSIEKFQVRELSAICDDGASAYTDGNWDSQLNGNAIRVTWQEHHCHDPGLLSVSGYDFSNASYGLEVWVVGPVLNPGESPWQDGVN